MAEDDSVMKIWDEAAEAWSDFVREGKDYYRDGLNNPAAFKMIGNIKGKRVLDIACGEGYNTRILAKKGARVTGVDFSSRMIELARQKETEESLGITYLVSDAAHLKDLPTNHFDLVTCFMSLQDVEHYEKAVSEVARVLKEDGRFVFSISHPCFEQIVKDDRGWRNVSGRRCVGTTESIDENGLSQLQMKGYFGTVRYEILWTMERISKLFKTVSFHRTLTDYFRALHAKGLLISRLVEPRPTSKALSNYPSLKKRLEIPQSMIIESRKIAV